MRNVLLAIAACFIVAKGCAIAVGLDDASASDFSGYGYAVALLGQAECTDTSNPKVSGEIPVEALPELAETPPASDVLPNEGVPPPPVENPGPISQPPQSPPPAPLPPAETVPDLKHTFKPPEPLKKEGADYNPSPQSAKKAPKLNSADEPKIVYAYSDEHCINCPPVIAAIPALKAHGIKVIIKNYPDVPSFVDAFPTLHWQAADGSWKKMVGFPGAAAFLKAWDATQGVHSVGVAQRPHRMCPKGADTKSHMTAAEIVERLLKSVGKDELRLTSSYGLTIPEHMRLETSRTDDALRVKCDGPEYPHLILHLIGSHAATIEAVHFTATHMVLELAGYPDVPIELAKFSQQPAIREPVRRVEYMVPSARPRQRMGRRNWGVGL